MYEFFISYSRKDSNLLRPLIAVANEMNINYFIDRDEIHGGEDYFMKITEALNQSKVVLFIWTDNSAESKYVKKEISYSIKKDKKIIPVKLGNVGDSHFDLALSDLNWIEVKKLNDKVSSTILTSITQNVDQDNKGITIEPKPRDESFSVSKFFKKNKFISKLGIVNMGAIAGGIINPFVGLGILGVELFNNKDLIPQNLIKEINEKLKDLTD